MNGCKTNNKMEKAQQKMKMKTKKQCSVLENEKFYKNQFKFRNESETIPKKIHCNHFIRFV